MDWEIVIGLETHVQLSTASKIFSDSSTAFGAEPNTQANAVDMALPGALPVFNRAVAEKAVMFGLAVGAQINQTSVFARKNYFYRSEEHTSELQSRGHLVCRLLLQKNNYQ